MSKPAHSKWSRFCILYLSILSVSNIIFASLPSQYTISEDLSQSWKVYENDYKKLVPYLSSRHDQYQSISQWIDLQNDSRYQLFVETPENSFLFVNNKYQKKLVKGWNRLSLDSLGKIYSDNYPKLLLTIYAEQPFKTKPAIYKTFYSNKALNFKIRDSNPYPLKIRAVEKFKDFMGFFIIFLMIVMTAAFNFQGKILTKFINLKDLFTLKNRIDPLQNTRPFEILNIIYLIILSLILSLILMITQYKFEGITIFNTSNINQSSFFSLSFQYFNLGFLIFVSFILKYLQIYFISGLYKFEKFANYHYFKNLQSLGTFGVMALLVLFALALYPNYSYQFSQQNLIVVVLTFFILRTILLFFILNRLVFVNSLYLFSYLCIVEIIPLFIGLRLVL